MIIKSVSRLSIKFPNGRVWEHSPGRFEIRTFASEASGEGVEGEPEATLGGVGGSPLGNNWCRFCGDPAFEQSTCVSCWSASFETSMSVSGQVAGQAMTGLAEALGQAMAPPTSQALDSIRSLGLTSEEAAENLAQSALALKQPED